MATGDKLNAAGARINDFIPSLPTNDRVDECDLFFNAAEHRDIAAARIGIDQQRADAGLRHGRGQIERDSRCSDTAFAADNRKRRRSSVRSRTFASGGKSSKVVGLVEHDRD
jgi:hypothetical protein